MTTALEVPGPWSHHYVAANGARFHVATLGEGPRTVVLLHGFPQFWWSWRHQMAALADQGFRVVAMDLRGYGTSDKTPNGYDPFTLAGDVAGVIAAMGSSSVDLVGHGWGGYIAWSVAAIHPRVVDRLAVVSAPHPAALLASMWRGGPGVAHVLAMQVPWLPERRLHSSKRNLLAAHLRAWSAPGARWPSPAEVDTYRAAISVWPAAHCALEYHRWLFRSRLRADGRRYRAAIRTPLHLPVLAVYGALDPVLPPARRSRSRWVQGPYREVVVDGAGHFVPEESPTTTTRALVDWLG